MIIFEKIRWKNFLSTGNVFSEVDLEVGRTNLIARCKRLGISLKNPDLDGAPTFQI